MARPEVRCGRALLSPDSQADPLSVRLKLYEDRIVVQREEFICTHTGAETVDQATLARERTVIVRREKLGGLGLSVKGGSEHNLPVLISRIFKDQAADKTGQLFVGDAILKVNSITIDGATHDQAVTSLKTAGDTVALQVKYFRPAQLFFSKSRGSSKDEDNNESCNNTLSRQWNEIACIKLRYAYVTRYIRDTDKTRVSSFEVFDADRYSPGVITISNPQDYANWVKSIQHNIALANSHIIGCYNKQVLPSQQLSYMSWVSSRTNTHWQSWHQELFVLRGADICCFHSPPTKHKDWSRPDSSEKIYESMFQIVKESDLIDNRENCFMFQFGQSGSKYISCDSRQQLLDLEKCWYKTNYLAVRHIGSRTFGCTHRGRASGLTLDLVGGFSLLDTATKTYVWSYRFSQLKGSSDDGKSELKLHFQSDQSQDVDTKELTCNKLRILLFSIHAFLSAKLASVDLSFLINS